MAKRERQISLGKFLSKHLRHTPEEIGLTLDGEGWALVDELLERARAAGRGLTREELEEVVASNEKQRFAFDASGKKIRANQGHSISVDLALPPTAPPPILYHGTALHFLDSILQKGLIRGKRQYVHLSTTTETAEKVGQRHGRPIILIVRSQEMHEAGHLFFLSQNGVWLIESVPPAYLSVLSTSGS